MNYFVVGASGMLGKCVVEEVLKRENAIVHVPKIRFGRHKFNQMSFSGADVIINCAGSIPLKEPRPTEMIEANTIGPWQLAKAAKVWGSRLVHMSTDCVFSGKTQSLSSSSNPDPIDLYGRTKLAGEPWGDNIVVARGSFIGPDHGFVRWLIEAEGNVQAWTKAFWNGGSVRAMARALVDLAEGDKEGVVHVAAEKRVTKAWMVEYLIDALDLPVGTINLINKPYIWRALEPDIVLPPVKDSLDEVVEELKNTEEEWKNPQFRSLSQ